MVRPFFCGATSVRSAGLQEETEYQFVASLIASRPVRRAAIAGAIALGAVIVPAAPALAAPVDVPGVGSVDVPGLPANFVPPQLPQMPQLPFAAPIGTVGDRAASTAESKVGSPYVYGASGPNAFDCSGLVQWAFRQAGRDLPRTSYAQATVGTPVPLNDLHPGDIVTFYGGEHVGIYVGGGNVVHAPQAGTPVKIAPISSMPVYVARRV